MSWLKDDNHQILRSIKTDNHVGKPPTSAVNSHKYVKEAEKDEVQTHANEDREKEMMVIPTNIKQRKPQKCTLHGRQGKESSKPLTPHDNCVSFRLIVVCSL